MNNRAHIKTVLNEAERNHRHRRTLSRMAAALEATFLIAPGDGLVYVLGDGSERNNHEALITWLQREIDSLETEISIQILPELAGRLDEALSEWELSRG